MRCKTSVPQDGTRFFWKLMPPFIPRGREREGRSSGCNLCHLNGGICSPFTRGGGRGREGPLMNGTFEKSQVSDATAHRVTSWNTCKYVWKAVLVLFILSQVSPLYVSSSFASILGSIVIQLFYFTTSELRPFTRLRGRHGGDRIVFRECP